MAHARESRPDLEDQTPVQSVSELIAAAEAARTGVRKAVHVSTPPNEISTAGVTAQPIPTLPPVPSAPFSPPSLEDSRRIMSGDYHPRAKVPSVRRTVD